MAAPVKQIEAFGPITSQIGQTILQSVLAEAHLDHSCWAGGTRIGRRGATTALLLISAFRDARRVAADAP
jgi:hypothetical protein